MKRVRSIICIALCLIICVNSLTPVFALQDVSDVSASELDDVLSSVSQGALYPLIKDSFYDSNGELRQTYSDNYASDDMDDPSEDLPGKTPVEFSYALDTVNNRTFLGYCYREDGSLFYDIYAQMGLTAKRILHYEHPMYVNPFRSSIKCNMYQKGNTNVACFTSTNNYPGDESDTTMSVINWRVTGMLIKYLTYAVTLSK